ncbi:TPA: hypothetical protein MIW27_001232 [Clostridioides difficile]|nr:hypothetical protein [Clostridioides difficile]HBY3419279.1 hypothetical protein [Clostridioides difficile]
MAKKNVNYNEVFVSGEVLDILAAERVKEGTPQEAIKFKLNVAISQDKNEIVDYYGSIYTSAGGVNKISQGLETVVNDIVTRAEEGRGEIVRCTCQLDDNTYYSDGEKHEGFRIQGKFCNRQKDAKLPIKAGILWRAYVYLEEIIKIEEGLEVIGIINKYNDNGFRVRLVIDNTEVIKEFEKLYKVGDVPQLEGDIVTEIIEGTGGFGTGKKDKIIKYLRITGGSGNKISKENDFGEDGKPNPFYKDNIVAMIDKMEEKENAMKEKDAQNNNINIEESDLPF